MGLARLADAPDWNGFFWHSEGDPAMKSETFPHQGDGWVDFEGVARIREGEHWRPVD